MRVNREALLRVLEMVSPGLSQRETIAQSSCLVFLNGKVCTFNEEILCTIDSPLKEIECAVKAKPFLDLLAKLPDEDLEVEQKPGELLIKGKGRRAGIRAEAQIELPVEAVETPEVWRDLDKDFSDAVSTVCSCASTDEAQFVLTCVHISPVYMEACDRYQICRYPLDTGVDINILVRSESLRRVVGYDMTEVSETESWIHFRNPAGLVMSVRRFLDEYKNLDAFVTPEGITPIILPGAIDEVVGRAEIFSRENATGNHIKISLREDRLMITGLGASGHIDELKQISYRGDPIEFMIAPNLLLSMTKKSNECGVGSGRLFIDTGKFRLSICTMIPSEVLKPEEKKAG